MPVVKDSSNRGPRRFSPQTRLDQSAMSGTTPHVSETCFVRTPAPQTVVDRHALCRTAKLVVSPDHRRSTVGGSGIFIRRMIVVIMDVNHISERLSSLKNETSDLRGTNARYWNRKGHTPLQKSASALRYYRLVEIKLELADMMKRCA